MPPLRRGDFGVAARGGKTSSGLPGVDRMTSAICTLFGGHYHYGLGVLANSLYAHGYRGTIFAGYDGPLPPWAKNLDEKDGCSDFKVADGLTIRFIELPAKVNHVYYKPDFM